MVDFKHWNSIIKVADIPIARQIHQIPAVVDEKVVDALCLACQCTCLQSRCAGRQHSTGQCTGRKASE